MTFSKPSSESNQTGAFTYKGAISSNAMNYIDNSFPNICDKTNGDTVTGPINFAATSVLTFGGVVLYQVSSLPASGSTYTADSNGFPDYFILVNTSTTAKTITLPSAVTAAGRTIVIKDSSGNAATHAITVQAAVGLVDGSPSETAAGVGYGGAAYFADGSNWYSVGTIT